MMVVRIALFILIAAMIHGSVSAESKLADDNYELSGAGKVRLTATLLRSEIGYSDYELYSNDLTLRVKYYNFGNQPILVHKKIGVSFLRLAKNITAMNTGQYEASLAYTLIPESDDRAFMTIRDFVILKKDNSFETEVLISVFVSRDPRRKIGDTVTSGPHALSFGLSSWPWESKETEQLQKKFGSYGTIITQTLATQPICIMIQPNGQR